MSDTAATGQMEFHQYALPPLESGNFTVTVKQQIAVSGVVVDTFKATQAMFVAGERYALLPADIDSVFPPMGNQGEFSNNLAHVVFRSPTLPWQRSPYPPNTPKVNRGATWLGVLLFDQDDPPPAPQAVTVNDLQKAGTTFFPDRIAEVGEDVSAPVTVIDVPIALFNQIAPSLADLAWTAHMRVVDPAAKASGDAPPTIDYGVVFGNRLPVAGNTATAHLVSFEDFGPFLPAEDGTGSAGIPAATTLVRVVSLKSWTFTALDLKQTFEGLLTHLDTQVTSLQMPFDTAKESGNTAADTAADTAVKNAFGMGYTAMDHRLRDGSSTVSWYRGPLLPLGVPVTLAPPYGDSDELLRFDPATGMFDVSYSSAWQLGRLLALHDAAFAAALYRWKLTQTQMDVRALEQQIIGEELPPLAQPAAGLVALGAAAPAATAHAQFAAVVRTVLGPAAAAMQAAQAKGKP